MIEIIYGNEDDLLGPLIPIGDKKILMRRGGILKDFDPKDKQTTEYWWKQAKRRRNLLILHSEYGGHAVVSIVPPDKFNFDAHRVQPRFKMDWLGSHIKPQTVYIFAEEEVLDKLKQENNYVSKPTTRNQKRSASTRTKTGKPRKRKRNAKTRINKSKKSG